MTDKKFVEECLAAMNSYRAVHQVAPLTYNNEIEQVSKNWANHLAKTNSFAHNQNPTYHGKELGENIASSWSSNHEGITGAQIVEQWYNEIERYDFKTHNGPKTGHFTQLVWKGSKEVGVGRSHTKDGTWLVVANYFPPGNFVGDYAKNVFPPKDGKIPVVSKKDADSNEQQKIDSAKGHGTTSHGNTNPTPAGSVRREVRTETVGNTKKTTTTETSTGHDGVITIKVTEKTEGQGRVTKTKITETIKKPDGSTTTKTTEKEEHGMTTQKTDQVTLRTSPEDEVFRRDVVQHHNSFRRLRSDTGDLVLNDELTGLAQTWADHLAKTKSLQQIKSTYRGEPVGQNVASKHGTGSVVDYTGEEVVRQWYKGSEVYDHRNPHGAQSGIGHFTQVVWKETTDIGVAKAFSSDNRVYVVALYHPAGNYVGRENYERNVCPLKDVI